LAAAAAEEQQKQQQSQYLWCGSSANALSPRDSNSGGEEVGVVCGTPTLTLSALLLAQGMGKICTKKHVFKAPTPNK
jgi:hypothetical protein